MTLDKAQRIANMFGLILVIDGDAGKIYAYSEAGFHHATWKIL
jgi:hypothetical protein